MQLFLNKAIALTHPYSPSSAPSTDEESTYSKTRIFLRWLSAAVILWATFSGFGVALLNPDHPFRQWVEAFNPQLTSLFIPFFAWRLWLAIMAAAHHPPKRAQQCLASAVHLLIYAVVSGVLITGVLMMDHEIRLLGLLPLPQLIHSETALAELDELHRLLCAVLAALVALHLGAVVMHQVRGKSVLGRMSLKR